MAHLSSFFIDHACPRDSGKIRSIGILQVETDGKVTSRACNGCEFLSGDPRCTDCINAVTDWLLNHPGELPPKP